MVFETPAQHCTWVYGDKHFGRRNKQCKAPVVRECRPVRGLHCPCLLWGVRTASGKHWGGPRDPRKPALWLCARDCFSLSFASGINFATNGLTEKGEKRKGKNEGSRPPKAGPCGHHVAAVHSIWPLMSAQAPPHSPETLPLGCSKVARSPWGAWFTQQPCPWIALLTFMLFRWHQIPGQLQGLGSKLLSRKVDASFPLVLWGQQVVRGLASPVSVGFTVPWAWSGQIPPPGSVPGAGVCLLACGNRVGMGGGQRPGPWDAHVWLWPPLAPPLSGVGACPHPRLLLPSPSTPGQVGLLRPLCLGPGPCGQGKGANSWPALEVPQNTRTHQCPAQSRGGPGSPACYFWRS